MAVSSRLRRFSVSHPSLTNDKSSFWGENLVSLIEGEDSSHPTSWRVWGGAGWLSVSNLVLMPFHQIRASSERPLQRLFGFYTGNSKATGLKRLQSPRDELSSHLEDFSGPSCRKSWAGHTHTYTHTSNNNPLWTCCNPGLNIQENTWVILTYLTGVLLTIN